MRWVGGSGSQLGEEQDSGAIKMAMGAAAGSAASGLGSASQAIGGVSKQAKQDKNAEKQEAADAKRHNELMGGLSQMQSTPNDGDKGPNGKD